MNKGNLSRRIFTAVFFAGLIVSQPAVAGEPVSLYEAIDGALAGNHNLAAKGHALDAAVWAHRLAKSQLFPSISLNSTYTRLDDETVMRANAFGNEMTMYFPDSTGTLQAYTIEIPQMVFRDGYETSVTGQMLLFSPAVWNGVSLAGVAREIAAWTAESARQETVHGTLCAFLDLLKMQSLLEVQRKHMDQAAENTALAERLFDVGRHAEADVLRWRVEEASQRGVFYQQESGRRVAALALENMIGAEPTGATVTDTLLTLAIRNEIERFRGLTPGEWKRFEEEPLEKIVQKNPVIPITGLTIRLAELEHRQSRTAFLPSVTLSGSYGWQNNDTFEPDGDRTWSATAAFHMPIFTSLSNYSALRVTGGKVGQAEEEAEETRRSIFLSTEAARSAIRANTEMLRLAETSLESAGRNHEIQKNRFSLGQLTNLEWIDANLALQEAEQIYVSTYYDLSRAIADLYQARGGIFDLLNR